MLSLYLEHMQVIGGLGENEARTRALSTSLYRFIDDSDGYYQNSLDQKHRSPVSVSFRIKGNDKECSFVL